MVVRLLVAFLLLLLAFAGGDARARQAGSLPRQGVVEPGKSFAGVKLGDTVESVSARWGPRTKACRVCTRPTSLYVYPREATGIAVAFDRRRVVAVYTIGSPAGWRTREGIRIRGDYNAATRAYGDRKGAEWRQCIGYGALTFASNGARTSIFVYGESVYGFSLSTPSEPVCR